MEWCASVKPLLFEMSIPQFFIKAPCALNRASGSEEGAPTESLAPSRCEYLRKRNILVEVVVMVNNAANSFALFIFIFQEEY